MNRTILFCSIFMLTISSCHEDSSVKPPDVESCIFPPGNRNFAWRSDTVAWFPSTLGGVWAFSDNDAYLMGNIVTKDSPSSVLLGLHWDGNQWGGNIHGGPQDIRCTPNDVTGDDHFMVAVGYWGYGSTSGVTIVAGIAEFDNDAKKWTGYQFQTQGQLRAVWTDGEGYFIAVGDNGMLYTKDAPSANWVYHKAPTDFNFYRVCGVSKNETYLLAYFNTSGITYPQMWRFEDGNWLKLLDGLDTLTSIIKIPGDDNTIGDLFVDRCVQTDSLQLYVVGWESYLFEAKGKATDFAATNLSNTGLPLRSTGRTALDINGFSPSDIWIFGARYNFYHWNGNNFQRMIIPGLPNNDLTFGDQRKMVKTKSGKVFLPSEVSSQVYIVLQGTP